jgi:hypothetical protein
MDEEMPYLEEYLPSIRRLLLAKDIRVNGTFCTITALAEEAHVFK